MKNKWRIPHLVTLCFLLTVLILLLSWLLDAYGISIIRVETGEEVRVQSLLSPEGIRWGLRNVVGNFTGFWPLWWGVILAFGIGVAGYSGFIDAFLRLCRVRWKSDKSFANGEHLRRVGAKSLSRKERRALIGALGIGLIYILFISLATFSSWSILRGVSGGLIRSPFLSGLPFLLSLLFGLMGGLYGFSSGTFRTDGDLFRAMARPFHRLGACFVIAFFLAQMFACIRYSGLDYLLYSCLVHLFPLFS